MTICFGKKVHNIQLRLLHVAYFCENLCLCIFVLLSFMWSDGDLSLYIHNFFDILVKCLGMFCCQR